MTLAEIYAMSRMNTGTDSVNLTDANLLTITNVTYRDLINIITSKVSEDFFYDEWTSTTVIGQSEYTFPVRTASVAGLKKLIDVSVKYVTTDQYLTQLSPSNISNFEADRAYYEANQPKSDPVFAVYDKSVAIFPAPTDTLSMKIYGISDPIELQDGATEAQIKIPVDFHHVIVLGNEYRIQKARRNVNEKNDALAEYQNEVSRMVAELSDRIIRPLESQMPTLNHLD